MSKILLIEDEQLLGKIVKESLEIRDFEMAHAKDGKEGLQLYREWQPELIVLDIMMPEMDGLSLAKIIRKEDQDIPIIFLTARSQPADVVKGFETGGNDYLKKPFSMDELIVRIKELLKRNNVGTTEETVFRLGSFIFDYEKQLLQKETTALTEDETYNLSYREAGLLFWLCKNKNNVMERKQVLLELWGDDNFFNVRSMDVYISKLRAYLKDDPSIQIINIRGIGYKLID